MCGLCQFYLDGVDVVVWLVVMLCGLVVFELVIQNMGLVCCGCDFLCGGFDGWCVRVFVVGVDVEIGQDVVKQEWDMVVD